MSILSINIVLGLCMIFGISLIYGDDCGKAGACGVEIVFVMDSSGSISGLTEWPQMVDFVEAVIDNVGGHSHFGITEFDHDTNTIYSLCNTQDDCDEIKSTLNAYPKDGGGTNIPLGVEAGIDMFDQCDDPSLPNVMVLLTDGFGGDPCYLKTTLDSKNIQTYLVKIGSGVSNTAIDCLVDDITTDIFEANDFNALADLVTNLASTVCTNCELDFEPCENDPCNCATEVTNCRRGVCHANGCDQCEDGYWKLDYDHNCVSCDIFGEGCLFCQDFHGCGQCDYPRYHRTYSEECGVYICVPDGSKNAQSGVCDNEDIILAVDESGSLDDSEFQTQIQFGSQLITQFSESRIGIIGFGTNARTIYTLDDNTAAANVALTSMFNQLGGFTNYYDTILDAIDMFANHGEPNTPDILLFISDGQPNTGGNQCNLKSNLDAAGITVVIVGIGSGFNPASPSITCLVNNPGQQIFYQAQFSNEELTKIIGDIAEVVCPFQCPNGASDSSLDIDESGCPIACDPLINGWACDCTELCFCDVCHLHSNGCDQCQNGYFKKGYNYPCISCDEIFNGKCQFCQDFNGCGQCKQGYTRYYDNTCGLWSCY